MLNQCFAGMPAWVVCTYEPGVLPERVVADAYCTHPVVSSEGRRGLSAAYVETDQWVERPLVRSAERVGGAPVIPLYGVDNLAVELVQSHRRFLAPHRAR